MDPLRKHPPETDPCNPQFKHVTMRNPKILSAYPERGFPEMGSGVSLSGDAANKDTIIFQGLDWGRPFLETSHVGPCAQE